MAPNYSVVNGNAEFDYLFLPVHLHQQKNEINYKQNNKKCLAKHSKLKRPTL